MKVLVVIALAALSFPVIQGLTAREMFKNLDGNNNQVLERSEINSYFNGLDTNGDGELTPTDIPTDADQIRSRGLLEYLDKLGSDDDRVQRAVFTTIFSEMDSKEDSRVTFDEFKPKFKEITAGIQRETDILQDSRRYRK